MNGNKHLIAGILALTLMLPLGASATFNSVPNGGFETGSLPPWTFNSGSSPNPGTATVDTYANFGIAPAPNGETYALQISHPAATGPGLNVYNWVQSASPAITSFPGGTTGGSTYVGSYDVFATRVGVGYIQLDVNFWNSPGYSQYQGGQNIGGSFVAAASNTWYHVVVTNTAPATWNGNRLDIRGLTVQGPSDPAVSWLLDNVSLEFMVPEPSTVMLLSIGGVILWRKKRQ